METIHQAVPQEELVVAKNKRILAVSLFDGIAALRVSLNRACAPVFLYVGAEIDPAARRCVRRWLPNLLEYTDVKLMAEEEILRIYCLWKV